MIDSTPTYSDNEIMQQIREKYGTERTTLEGITETSGAIQDGLRPGESEGGQPSETIRGHTESNGRKPRKTRRDIGVTRGSYKRKGRASTEAHQGNRRNNSGSRPANGTVLSDQREPGIEREAYASKEDKPAGLDAKPNAKERKIREEQERAEAAARSAAASETEKPQNFFTWLRPRDKGKASKGSEKSNIRSKPLSAKEADEIRQPLIDAMIDYFKYADELMSGTSANGAEAIIWSSIDDEEIGILIDAWLSRAKVDPVAAHYAVEAVNSHYKLKVGLILAPRFYKTFCFYVDNGVRSPFPAQRRKQSAKQKRPLAVVRDN